MDWKPNAPVFADRLDAGKQLGEELQLRGYGDEPAIVLAIPRGGVPVAHGVTQILGTPLEVIIPGKLRLPSEPETAFGAIAPDGTLLLDLSQVESLALEAEEIKRLAAETFSEMRRQMETYRNKRSPLDLEGKTVILVDDGLASGFTMLAAVRAVRHHAPARVVVAVPVSPFSAVDRLAPLVDDLVCLVERDDTDYAIARAYTDLADLSDDQVCTFLWDVQTQ